MFKKFIVSFLIYLLIIGNLSATDLPVTDGTTFTFFNSSYFTVMAGPGRLIYAAQALYWNDKHLRQWSNNRSGGSLIEAIQGRLQKYGLPAWSITPSGGNIYVEYWSDNNGGYSPGPWNIDVTNLFNAPGLLWNDTNGTYVNWGGWASNNAGRIKFIIGGSIPVGPKTGSHYQTGSLDQQLDAAAQATISMSPGPVLTFGNFYYLDSYANWTNDILNATHYREMTKYQIGGFDEEHPGCAGIFAMAVNALDQRMDTNTWTLKIKYYSGQQVSTNHCVLLSSSVLGNSLTFTMHSDRHSMPFEMPDPTVNKTNDSSTVFLLQPAYSNAFYEVFCCPDIPDGMYQIVEDGVVLGNFDASIIRNGFNLFAITKGAIWWQRVHVLDLYTDRMGYYRTNLVASNGGTAFGEQTYEGYCDGNYYNPNWGTNSGPFGLGLRGDALITAVTSSVGFQNATNEDPLIWAAATPTNHIFTISKISDVIIKNQVNFIGNLHFQ